MNECPYLQPYEDLVKKFGGSEALVAKIANTLLASWGADYKEFADNLLSGNGEEAARKLHRVKGAVGYFVTDELHQQIIEVETLAKEGRLEEARQQEPGLLGSLERFDNALRAAIER